MGRTDLHQHGAPGQRPRRGPTTGLESELDAELDHLEVDVYRTLSIRAAADLAASRAGSARLHRQRLRARLLVSDVDSRTGHADLVLDTQLRLRTEAIERGHPDLARRANTYLASTYDRIGDRQNTIACAWGALQPPDQLGGAHSDPPGWRAEALMVLALMSMSRPGADVELMDRAREAVREHCPPTLLAATEANFAESAGDVGRPDIARQMAAAATLTMTRHPSAEAVLTWESIARGRACGGDLAGAVQAIDRALEIEPELGVCDTNGDPWLTAAELLQAQGAPERGLAVLAARRRPRGVSMGSRVRELRVRARLLASLERWPEAYAILEEHVDLYEQFRSFEGDQYVERIQSRAAATEERERARQFELLACTDFLTALPNRRGVDQWLERASIPDGFSLALAIVDVDHFKQVNDRFSHDVGDQVLCRLSDRLAASCTEHLAAEHLVGRLGGEEFVLAWTVRSHEQAIQDAEQIRRAVSDISFEDVEPGLAVTVSIGVTLVTDATELLGSSRPALARADVGLYAAKAAGRDAVRPG